MRRSSALLSAVTCSAFLLLSCGGPEPDSEQASAQSENDIVAPDCGDAVPLAQEMSSGSGWTMCFAVDSKRGAVLTDISFIPAGEEAIPLIQEMSLAQMEVPYDDGERLTSDISAAGFGGTRMHTLSPTECTGDLLAAPVANIGDGSQFGETPEREVLCSELVDSGLAYRSFGNGELSVARGDVWSLSTISKVGWYEYISEYNFGSDGSIRPALGATGDLSPVDYTEPEHGWPVGEGEADYAANHSHNVVWKVRWGIGEDGPLRVEQFDAEPTGNTGPESPILEGILTPIEEPSVHHNDDRRWWRVVAPELTNDNGHPASYQIDVGASDSFTYVHDEHHHGEETGYDIAFTNYDECQVLATENRGGCGSGVLEYIEEDDTETLQDVVSWVAVGYHHVPRDEDQSPMEVHWQSFEMLPRDLTSTRADVPEERRGIDGQPQDSEFLHELPEEEH